MAGAWAPRAGGWELGVWPAAPPAPSCCSTPVAGRSHVMQRVLSTAQFLWVLGQALVDGLTRWLHTFTRHHSAMSNVLRAERYLLTQELLRVSGGGSAPVPPRPPPCRPAPPRPAPWSSRTTPTLAALSQWLPCREGRCAWTCWTSCMPVKPRRHRQAPWMLAMPRAQPPGRRGPGAQTLSLSSAQSKVQPGRLSHCPGVGSLLAPCPVGSLRPSLLAQSWSRAQASL